MIIGGGNAKKIKELPPGCRRGGNHNAYFGGLRMWDDAALKEKENASKDANGNSDSAAGSKSD